MCGITGQFNFQRREPVERETIVRMARSIAHRGPDDEGYFISGPLGLGFRRLSIIDSLTGLGNYRAFVQALESEIQRSQRTGRHFALLLMDLDGLKQINDRNVDQLRPDQDEL